MPDFAGLSEGDSAESAINLEVSSSILMESLILKGLLDVLLSEMRCDPLFSRCPSSCARLLMYVPFEQTIRKSTSGMAMLVISKVFTSTATAGIFISTPLRAAL